MMVEQPAGRVASVILVACDSPMQIIATVRQYFGLHFQESIDLGQLPALLGISEYCLDLSFEQVRDLCVLALFTATLRAPRESREAPSISSSPASRSPCSRWRG